MVTRWPGTMRGKEDEMARTIRKKLPRMGSADSGFVLGWTRKDKAACKNPIAIGVGFDEVWGQTGKRQAKKIRTREYRRENRNICSAERDGY